MVMRITHGMGTCSRATLRIEGSVVGEWAGLLERECSDLLRSCDAVSLDLAEVTFVDRAGVEALVRLSGEGVEILCRPGAVASVLEAEGVRVRRRRETEEDARP